MGESIVDLPRHTIKMGETDASSSDLEVSVSFGRFENASLSWEKWSAFSPNKYLEEVEKCATPGSVAKKAAYFEAHYKKIAAKKAEVMDNEKQLNRDVVSSDDPNGRDLINDTCGSESTDAEFNMFKEPDSSEGFKRDNDLINNMNVIDVDDLPEEDVITIEFHTMLVEREKEELHKNQANTMLSKSEEEREKEELHKYQDNTILSKSEEEREIEELHKTQVNTMLSKSEEEREIEEIHKNQVNTMLSKSEKEREIEELQSNLVRPTLNKTEEVVSVVKEVVSVSIDTQGIKEEPQIAENEMGCDSKTTKEVEKVKAKNAKEPPKVIPMKKQSNVGNVKKKLVSTIAKTPKNATPRMSKSMSTSRPVPLTKSPKTKENGSSLPRSKNPPSTETNKVAPKSLYMSLSLVPKTSESSSIAVPRKSLIMEKMGDKEIVKRAFKTFQNSFSSSLRSSSEDGSSMKKQAPTQLTEANVSTSLTPRKENERPIKTSVMEKRSSKTPPSSSGLKSEDREEKRKELSKKLEATHGAEKTEKTRFQSKPKEEKEADVKKSRQNLNTKVTPMPGFNRGQKVSKSISDKTGSKSGVRQ